MTNGKSAFNHFYDAYSAMLLGLATEVSIDDVQAEKILAETFRTAHKNKIIDQPSATHCAALIRLLLKTAQAELFPGDLTSKLRIERFAKMPLLHRLLCEQLSMDHLCHEQQMDPQEATKAMRDEFNVLRWAGLPAADSGTSGNK